MTASLIEMEQEFRGLYTRFGADEILGSPLIRACIKNAVRRFSRYMPRPNRFANLSILKTDTYLTLPLDFILAPLRDIYLALTGISTNTLDVFSIFDFNDAISTRTYRMFDTQYGATQYPAPHWRGLSFPMILKPSIDDSGNYIIQFTQEFGVDKTNIKFFYGGSHVLDDGDPLAIIPIPPRNSIPDIYIDIVLDLAMGYAALARAKALLETDDPNFRKATEYQVIANKYFLSINQVASLGSAG